MCAAPPTMLRSRTSSTWQRVSHERCEHKNSGVASNERLLHLRMCVWSESSLFVCVLMTSAALGDLDVLKIALGSIKRSITTHCAATSRRRARAQQIAVILARCGSCREACARVQVLDAHRDLHGRRRERMSARSHRAGVCETEGAIESMRSLKVVTPLTSAISRVTAVAHSFVHESQACKHSKIMARRTNSA